ncbi:hypothetical protein O9G_004103 [Rozella allomycis CSF55]|uniref:DNA alkylation repair enzyme n=1 Tax=Rozella allomycis (strain CSF55) TaxID=988480 RepID=A0A075AVT8_ROZAC|nr:hypothetical protein O9G_004103 [Rozella allomycis CSF55]|eukprot:EPZ32832.1 hypothetical protein O9G_004103 [Rozella allomycis CSF55]
MESKVTPKDTSLQHLKAVLPSWYSDLLSSDQFWEWRIAIVSLLALKKECTKFVFEALELFLFHTPKDLKINDRVFDDHDLINKAIGWVLREAGKANESMLIDFLERNWKIMAKISVSYAIEKLEPKPAFLKTP